MTASGRHARGGPAPDPNALRRDRPSDAATWRHLPSAGRQGDAPAWPLSRLTARERALWVEMWRRPQAIVWEENGQQVEVAMFVRSLKDAERAKAAVAMRTLVRQQMDALGLTVPGLRANRWTIDGEEGEQRATARPAAPQGSARERLKLMVAS